MALAAEEFRATEGTLDSYQQKKDEKQLYFIIALLVLTCCSAGFFLLALLGELGEIGRGIATVVGADLCKWVSEMVPTNLRRTCGGFMVLVLTQDS